jgi:hypothetical protein
MTVDMDHLYIKTFINIFLYIVIDFFRKRNNVPATTKVYSLQLLHNSALHAETRETSLIQ